MRVVLTDTALTGERLDRGRAGIGWIDVERHARMERAHQAMKEIERVALGFLVQSAGKCRDMASSACVNSVDRRNRLGGKGSSVPRSTPPVSIVSTCPST